MSGSLREDWGVPIHIRTRLALTLLVGLLLIPIFQSNLRGIDHILTCTEQVETPFQVVITDGLPIVTGSTTLEPGDPELFCGGLGVEISVGPSAEKDVRVFVDLSNESNVDWFGTVDLTVGSTRIPVDLGRVPPGSSLEESIELSLPEGATAFTGSLLIGP